MDRWHATDIPVRDIHELAAGKLGALLSRRRARNLFDCRQLLLIIAIDLSRLRTAFVVYGAMKQRDWRTLTVDGVASTRGNFPARRYRRPAGSNNPRFGHRAVRWTHTGAGSHQG